MRFRHLLTAIASAMFLAKGVDHCRAELDAHRIPPVEAFRPKTVLVEGLDHPNSLTPARTLILSIIQFYEYDHH